VELNRVRRRGYSKTPRGYPWRRGHGRGTQTPGTHRRHSQPAPTWPAPQALIPAAVAAVAVTATVRPGTPAISSRVGSKPVSPAQPCPPSLEHASTCVNLSASSTLRNSIGGTHSTAVTAMTAAAVAAPAVATAVRAVVKIGPTAPGRPPPAGTGLFARAPPRAPLPPPPAPTPATAPAVTWDVAVAAAGSHLCTCTCSVRVASCGCGGVVRRDRALPAAFPPLPPPLPLPPPPRPLSALLPTP
jgi:hypothetical protein